MADRETMLQLLEELYEDKEYEVLIKQLTKFIEEMETLLEMKENPEFKKRVHMLLIKAPLALYPIQHMQENTYELTANSLDTVTAGVNTLEEFYAIEKEVSAAVKQWHDLSIAQGLQDIKAAPLLDSWKTYLDMYQELISKTFSYTYLARANGRFSELLGQEGLTADEAAEKYKEAESTLDATVKEKLEFDAACEIFDGAVNYINEWRDASSEAVKATSQNMFSKLELVKLMISSGIPDNDEKLEADLHYARLAMLAKVQEYELELVIYPNGRAMSLLVNRRRSYIDELAKTYRRIGVLDKNFIPPDLPPARGLQAEDNNPGYENFRIQQREAEDRFLKAFAKEDNDANIREAMKEFKEGNPFTAKCRFHVAMYKMPDEPIGYVGKALAKWKHEGASRDSLIIKAEKYQGTGTYAEELKELLEYEIDPLNRKMLMEAVLNGNYGTAEALINLGADVNCTNHAGITPLWCLASGDKDYKKSASTGSSKKLAEMLLEKGAGIDVVHPVKGIALYNSSTNPDIAALIKEKYPDAQMGKSQEDIKAEKMQEMKGTAKKVLIIVIALAVLITAGTITVKVLKKANAYKEAIGQLDSGNYSKIAYAQDIFEELNGYKDSEKYSVIAEALLSAKNDEYGLAYELLTGLGDFANAKKLAEEVKSEGIKYAESYAKDTKELKTTTFATELFDCCKFYPKLSGKEIKEKIVGNWYMYSYVATDGSYFTFYGDGKAESVDAYSFSDKDKVRNHSKSDKWSVENNQLVYKCKEVASFSDTYDVYEIEGVLILYAENDDGDGGSIYLMTETDKSVEAVVEERSEESE